MEKIKFKQFTIEGLDGKEIKAYKMEPKKIEATFHIAHGLSEYARRYEHFANYLYSKNIAVYSLDNRGHGETIEDINNLGLVEKKDIPQIVNDHIILSKLIKEENPNVPSIMLGHSFGSFVAQKYIQQYHEDQLVILSGTNCKVPYMFLAKWVANLFSLTGRDRQSLKLARMSIDTRADYLGETKTPVDWLSRDPEICAKYMKDPFCNKTLPISWYRNMFEFLKPKNLYSKKGLKQIDPEIPIYLFSGKNDPVGSQGKNVKKLAKMYEDKLGVKNVSLKLYDEGRHEMLNEINKEEVYEDVYKEVKKLIK